jgi:thiamine transport system permease protein
MVRTIRLILILVFFGLVVGPVFAVLRSVSLSEFFSPDILSVVYFTLKQSTLSVLGSLLIGLPLGYWIFKNGSHVSRQRLLLLYSMPTLTVALAVSLTFQSYGLMTVIFAHVWMNAPWIALCLANGLEQFPENRRRAARSLGASAYSVLRDFEWPFLRARLLLASSQVFSVCVMSFTLVLLLGGGPPVQTLETEIYSSIKIGEPHFNRASVFGLWQLLLTCVPAVIAFFVSMNEEHQAPLIQRDQNDFFSLKKGDWITPLLFLPFISLIVSIRGKDFLGAFDAEAYSAFLVSLQIALAVAFGVVLLSLAIALVSKNNLWIFILFQIPSGVSALVLGLGFWLAYARWIDPFEGSLWAMILIQITLILPLGVRTLWPLAKQKNQSALDAARMMGANPLQAWILVEWPRWGPSVRSLVFISILWSMSELAAVSLFSSENLITLPLLISRWMSQYRFDQAIGINLVLGGLAWSFFRIQNRWSKSHV